MHLNHFKKGRSARATTKTGGSAALKKAAYSCARQTVTPAGRPSGMISPKRARSIASSGTLESFRLRQFFCPIDLTEPVGLVC